MKNQIKIQRHNFARAIRVYETARKRLMEAKRMHGDLLNAFVEIGDATVAVEKAHATLRAAFTTYNYVVYGISPDVTATMAV